MRKRPDEAEHPEAQANRLDAFVDFGRPVSAAFPEPQAVGLLRAFAHAEQTRIRRRPPNRAG